VFAVGSARHWHLVPDVPDKTSELARNGDADLVYVQLARAEAAVAVCEAQLCPPSDLAHRPGLAFLTQLQVAAEACREAIVPGRLNEHPPRMAVACLGDMALAVGITGGIFRRHQAQKSH